MLRKSYLDPIADMSYLLINIGRADLNMGGTFCGKRRKLASRKQKTRKEACFSFFPPSTLHAMRPAKFLP